MKLVNEVNPYIAPRPNSPNYRSLSSVKMIAMTLYYLYYPSTKQNICLESSIPTVSKIATKVCYAICTLAPKHTKLPQVAKFEVRFGLPKAFGCIDGTQIPIQTPSENAQDYVNYLLFHTLSVKAVCHYRGVFLDVECQWPGSVHYVKVFFNPKINKDF